MGNSKFGSSIFSKITAAAEEGNTTFPFTMGLNQFDFVDYDVFCEQVAATATQDTVNGIINICSGRPEKLADRVERFIKENNYYDEIYKRFVFNDKGTMEKYNKIYEKVKQYLEEKG